MSHDEDRAALKTAFIKYAGWEDAAPSAIPGDASTRAYLRLTRDRSHDITHGILMDAPPGAEAATCPPDATPEERKSLGYNAEARLAGPNLMAFVAISDALRRAGLRAPTVLEYDAHKGFAMLEDLGDGLFVRVVQSGADEGVIYRAAIDVLIEIARKITKPSFVQRYDVMTYDETAMLAEAALLTQWYWPHINAAKCPNTVVSEYISAWRETLAGLSTPHTLVLRDYHAENLLWLPEFEGLDRVGIIDFQDGLFGHGAYDVVSLIEDARRDVDAEFAAELLAYYKTHAAEQFDAFDTAQFDRDYAILAAQRNAKILGIFARLINRDGKDKYADFIPRVAAHMKNDLARPAVAPIKVWAEKYMSELCA